MFVVTEGECFVQKDGISKLEAKYSKGGFFGEGCLKAPTSHRANDPERPLRGASIVSQGGTGCLRITREAFLYAVESDKDTEVAFFGCVSCEEAPPIQRLRA